MTAPRRYLTALRMAVATFWHFSRPPLHELEIIGEIPAGTSPQAIPGDDALAQPPAVQDAFYANVGAGLEPAEALAIAQVSPAVMN